MALLGYARVSTLDQNLDLQLAALREAGCQTIFEEKMSGTSRARPELQRLLAGAKAGDTVVFWKLDRLGRSMRHLLEIAEQLRGKGVHLRCLTAPIDTTSPTGTLMFQMLGAFAEFERNLIAERTKAGLKAAAAQGRIGGNPALRRHDPEALRENAARRRRLHFEKLNRTAHLWLPLVRQMRPATPWAKVAQILNGLQGPEEESWKVPRLVAAVRRFVEEGLAEPDLLGRAPPDPADSHILTVVAAIKGTNPEITLKAIAERLKALGERPARGGRRWQPSSIRKLIEQARKAGLLALPPAT